MRSRLRFAVILAVRLALMVALRAAVRLALRATRVALLCISAGWYFVDFYGGKTPRLGGLCLVGALWPAQVRVVRG